MKVNLIKTLCLFIAFNTAHVLANSTDNNKRAKDIKQFLINKNNIHSDMADLKKSTLKNGDIQFENMHTNALMPVNSGDTDYFGNPIMIYPGDTDYFGNPIYPSEILNPNKGVSSHYETAQESILKELKTHYVNQIAARVMSQWRYHGAKDGWNCSVYILQDIDGNVQSVNLHSCDIGNNAKAKSFKNSIERAVYKASPLPPAPDKDVFDREILIEFRVN